jgi:hypothetical protein
MSATMRITKSHTEFHAVDMGAGGWHPPPGYPPEIEQKILAGDLDEPNKTGNRTRLLRFQAGAHTTTPFVHDHWEEVYVLSGDRIVTDESNPQHSATFGPNTYACRPPGISHGPFRSESGCVLLEVHYYDPAPG